MFQNFATFMNYPQRTLTVVSFLTLGTTRFFILAHVAEIPESFTNGTS